MVVGIGKISFLLGDLGTSSMIGHQVFDLLVNLGFFLIMSFPASRRDRI